MKPIPVVFHLGPLQVHTYGIGLAITFYFAYRYFLHRLRTHGHPTDWLGGVFVWVIVAAIVGARAVHVIANFTTLYAHHLIDVLAVWHGGLSSYGGLLAGIPTGVLLARRRCPKLSTGVALDLIAPVLVIAWAVGRLLGPQLMVRGGGHPTTAWFGMQYATGYGGYTPKELPVPIFQAIECTVIFVLLLVIERRVARGPVGVVALSAVALWNVSRFFDEFLYLNSPRRVWDAVEVGSLAAAAAACAFMLVLRARWVAAGRPVAARTGPGGGPGEVASPDTASAPGEAEETVEQAGSEAVPADVDPVAP